MNYSTRTQRIVQNQKHFPIFYITALIIFFFTCNIDLHGQERGILRGFVADSLSGEALPYANIYIKELNRGANTDFRGFFVMASLPNKRFTVVISYVGYRSKQFTVEIEPYIVTNLRALLAASNIQMKTIETIGERVAKENATDLSFSKNCYSRSRKFTERC